MYIFDESRMRQINLRKESDWPQENSHGWRLCGSQIDIKFVFGQDDLKQLSLFDINLTSESIDINLMSDSVRRVQATLPLTQ